MIDAFRDLTDGDFTARVVRPDCWMAPHAPIPGRSGVAFRKLSIWILAVWFIVLLPSMALPCETDFVNQTTVVFDSLEITLATDSATYALGDSVDFYLCISNLATTPFTWRSLDIPERAFWVLSDTCTTPSSWECLDLGPHVSPEVLYFLMKDTVIPPGTSKTWTHRWNGRRLNGELPPTGTFQVFGGLRGGDPLAETIGIPPGGAQLTLTLVGTSGVPTSTATWGWIKARVTE